MTVTILALSGSLRKGSFNTALLRAAAELAPEGVKLDLRTLHGIELYNGDVEAQGVPAPVTTLREALRAADGLLIATPEYNNSIPGVLKNGLDWLSRPPAEGKKTFTGKPTAMLGATPGNAGTLQSQDALLSVMRAFAVDFWMGGRITLSKAGDLVDAQGHLQDEKVREQIRGFLVGFADYIRKVRA